MADIDETVRVSCYPHSIKIIEAVRELFGGDLRITPDVESCDDGEVVVLWDEKDFFLEIGIFDYEEGDEDCRYFRWFFLNPPFEKGYSGIERASYISEIFTEILLEYVVIPE